MATLFLILLLSFSGHAASGTDFLETSELSDNDKYLYNDMSAYQWEFNGEQFIVRSTGELQSRYQILLALGYNPSPFKKFISSLYSKPGRKRGNWGYENIFYYAKDYSGEELRMIFFNLYRKYLITYQLEDDMSRYKLSQTMKESVVLVGNIESISVGQTGSDIVETLCGTVKNTGPNAVDMVWVSFVFDMSDGQRKYLDTYATNISHVDMNSTEEKFFNISGLSINNLKFFKDHSLIYPDSSGYFQLIIPDGFGLYDSYQHKIEYIES